MKTIKNTLLITMTVLLFFSCSTFKNGYFEKTGLTVADEINQGMHETLVSQSANPFVFETELLVSDTQLNMFWQGLTASGYSLDAPVVLQNRPIVVGQDYKLFSNSWEIRTFFEKYLNKNDSLVEVQGSDSSCLMIIRKTDQDFEILGWKEGGE